MYSPRDQPDTNDRSLSLIGLYNALQTFGLVGAMIILLTAVSAPSVRRHSTWINFMLSWIISCLSYLLLFFAGQQTGPEPDFGLCLVQSTLIYSVPALTAGTTLALVLHVWWRLRPMFSPGATKSESIWTISVLALPYIPFLAMLIASFAVGIRTPGTVRRTGSSMYCNMGNRVPGRVSAIFVTLAMVGTILVEAYICFLLRRNWRAFKRTQHSFSMITRVMGFSLFGGVAIALGLIFFSSQNRGGALNIVIAIIPAAAVLVFGTQMDLIRVWIFRPARDAENRQKELRSNSAGSV